MSTRKEPSLIPGAVFGLALVVATSGMSQDIINGWHPNSRRLVKQTVEPLLSFIECWFYPFPWCTPPDPPKILQPDRPIGWCSDTDTGPCQ